MLEIKLYRETRIFFFSPEIMLNSCFPHSETGNLLIGNLLVVIDL